MPGLASGILFCCQRLRSGRDFKSPGTTNQVRSPDRLTARLPRPPDHGATDRKQQTEIRNAQRFTSAVRSYRRLCLSRWRTTPDAQQMSVITHDQRAKRRTAPGTFAYELLGREELGARLHVSALTITRRWKKWGLKPVRISGRILFPSDQVAALERRLIDSGELL